MSDLASEPLVVRRWTRYGKDRLYVSTVAGVRVGWSDCVTGDVTVEVPEMAEALHAVLAGRDEPRERSADAALGQVPREPVSPGSEELAAEPAWTDLALNRPGQGVRAHAEALRAGMREQSKVATFLTRAFDVKTEERAFRVGAEGEEAVGARLDRLVKQGARVLHSIPVGKGNSDIDHLVITQGGVYPVNTKRHPGGSVWVGERAILVNGQRTDYLRNSRYEAVRVRTVLGRHLGVDVPVRPVLVFLTGTVVPDVTIKQMPDVLVLDRTDVPGCFKRAPERLAAEMIERVYDVARRSTSWS